MNEAAAKALTHAAAFEPAAFEEATDPKKAKMDITEGGPSTSPDAEGAPSLSATLLTLREQCDLAGIKRLVSDIFSDPDSLAARFATGGDMGDGDTPALGRPLDSEAIDAAFAELAVCGEEDEAMTETFVAAATVAADCLQRAAEPVVTLLLLLHAPVVTEGVTDDVQALLGKLCGAAAALPLSGRRQLVAWFRGDECSGERLDTWLKGLQQFITISVYQAEEATAAELQGVTDAIRLMALMHAANEECHKVPFTDFYNDAVNEELFSIQKNVDFVRRTYRDWGRDSTAREQQRAQLSGGAEEGPGEEWQPASYVSYPFILNPSIKSMVLRVDASAQQDREARANVMGVLMGTVLPYMVLRVRRENIVEDTMRQLVHCPPGDLKKQLKVKFIGEEGIDEGGVQKEFMQVVTRQLLDPQFAMFTANEETRQLYFNANTFELGLEFELVGTLVGIAIYNGKAPLL